jgi:hypothetical protein
MMKFLKNNKDTWDKPFSEKVARRVSKIPTGELEQWVDQSLTEIGRCLSGYQRSREKFYLDEARQGAEALHAVVEELHRRIR